MKVWGEDAQVITQKGSLALVELRNGYAIVAGSDVLHWMSKEMYSLKDALEEFEDFKRV